MASTERTDWTERHARTRPSENRRCVVVEELDDDWERRHAECDRGV